MTSGDRLAFVIGTWFGCGEARKAPGTMGSLGAIPLHWWLSRQGLGLHAGAILLITAVGTWAAQRMADVLHVKDPQRVVVDEVAGVLIAMAFVREQGIWAAVVAFVLFRTLDITKPGPVAWAEHAKPVGFGVMADDSVAGLAAGVVTRAGVFAIAALG